ncbi:hypothetical protein BK133_16180 [Paenibacillus sp. FSL H8-0548]|uniref:DUF1861 family protein n=1 Tax=Paenibacillus sp. FSL H8-0548 TaxID=1920422 RepID=UPI00096BE6A5|nr:DUF1861 family protein [Paenibacillus sp. FSL H8-0548]OMF30827.1 hypothetical protein BK133_16180 [Paenibacillus sp. FSL H8-0548]
MMKLEWITKTCKELLLEYQPAAVKGKKLHFAGVGDRDVYNITAPFFNEGELYIAGRVEERNSEESEIVFFTCKDEVWTPKWDLPKFQLQDPFITRINGEWILGGVALYFDEEPVRSIIGWKTVLYRGRNLHELVHVASGPWNMKDIRLTELSDGSIGIFSRPFGVEGTRAVIGFSILDSFEELSETAIIKAPLFRDQFLKDEWGGANEIHLLKNGFLGVLGHISYTDEEDQLHYHAMSFVLNPKTREKSAVKIIATRSDFPEGPAKRPDLVDVIFSGGLIREPGNRAVLYVGASDTEAHYINIEDPFSEFE